MGNTNANDFFDDSLPEHILVSNDIDTNQYIEIIRNENKELCNKIKQLKAFEIDISGIQSGLLYLKNKLLGNELLDNLNSIETKIDNIHNIDDNVNLLNEKVNTITNTLNNLDILKAKVQHVEVLINAKFNKLDNDIKSIVDKCNIIDTNLSNVDNYYNNLTYKLYGGFALILLSVPIMLYYKR